MIPKIDRLSSYRTGTEGYKHNYKSNLAGILILPIYNQLCTNTKADLEYCQNK